MSARQQLTVLSLSVLLGVLAFALTSRLWADHKSGSAKTAQLPQQPMSPEPPLAPPSGQPGVRDIPTPGTPPRVRITPAPVEGQGGRETIAPSATYCPVDPPAPIVSIKVRVPACAAVGEELEYRICVENHAKAAAHHVVVRNLLPANATYVRANPPPSASDPILEWRLGTLEGCDCREIVLVLTPTGTGDVKNCARVQFEHGECVVTKIGQQPGLAPAGEPKLTLRKIGPERAILHNTLDYRLIVTNAGTTGVRGIALTDNMDDGMRHAASNKSQLTWDVGTLAPGESRNYDYQVITTKIGKLCNRAGVTVGTFRQQAESCVIVGEAKLTVTKTGPAEQLFKRPAAYQITVKNEGSEPLTNVVVADELPPKTRVLGVPEGSQLRENQVEWSLGTLAPGARKTVQIALEATEAGKVVNKATARAAGIAPVSAEAATNFESAAGLTFYVEVKDNPAEVNKPTRYTITVVNQGNAAANDIDVSATLPKQMRIREIQPKDARVDGQQILFPRLPMLDGGKQIVYDIDVVPTEAGGDVAMKVTMKTKELPTGVTKEARTNIVPDCAPPEAR